MAYFKGNQYRDSLIVKVIRLTKRILIVSSLMALVGWGMYFGANYFPKTVTAQVSIPIFIESSTTPPVLQRIMKCESDASQKASNGQLTYHVNKDGTIDVGIMEINSSNFALATKLGFDVTKESDNIAFGKWLFMNRGSTPWDASRKCWQV